MADPFAFLNDWSADEIAALLADETPSVIATALKALPREMNTKVFVRLPAEHRDEIASAMATAKVSGSLLDIMREEIAAGLREKAAARKPQVSSRPAGDSPAASPLRPAKKTPAPRNELSAMLAHLSPKLRHNLEESSVLPAAKAQATASEPDTAAPRLQTVKFPTLDAATGEVFRPAENPPHASAARPAATVTRTGFSPAAEDSAAQEKYTDGLRRRSAIEQILQQRSQFGNTATPPGGKKSAAAPAGESAPGQRGFHKMKNQELQEEIAIARRMAARDENLKIDGMSFAASIIREAGAGVRDNLMHAMPELYAQLKQHMFVFDDLEKSPDQTLGLVFASIKPEVAALALRFASDALKERVLAALPARKANLINEEIARATGRVRLSDIEAAQQAIIDFAVHLQNQGKLIIDARDPDIV